MSKSTVVEFKAKAVDTINLIEQIAKMQHQEALMNIEIARGRDEIARGRDEIAASRARQDKIDRDVARMKELEAKLDANKLTEDEEVELEELIAQAEGNDNEESHDSSTTSSTSTSTSTSNSSSGIAAAFDINAVHQHHTALGGEMIDVAVHAESTL